MKILVVTNGFFPGKKYGGPPVSVDNLCNLINEHDFYIITKNHDLGEKEKYQSIKDGWNTDKNKQILYLSDAEFNIKRIENEIKKINPEIIYLQSLFQPCTIPCLYLAKKYNIKVLLAPRGELCKGAFRKKWKKIPYIKFLRIFGLIKNIHIQSTSDEETKMVEKYLKVKPANIHFLTNVPTVPIGVKNENVKVRNELKIIFMSRIVPKKNLLYALNCLKKVNGRVIFDIFGSIEDKDYWNECENLIRELPTQVEVNYKGLIEHKDVCITFSKYDLFFFPTKSENFGHVIVESLASGCPVLISNQTPFIELKKYGVGADFDLQNNSLFADKINEYLKLSNEEWRKMSTSSINYVKEKLNIEEIKKNYNNTFCNISKES